MKIFTFQIGLMNARTEQITGALKNRLSGHTLTLHRQTIERETMQIRRAIKQVLILNVRCSNGHTSLREIPGLPEMI